MEQGKPRINRYDNLIQRYKNKVVWNICKYHFEIENINERDILKNVINIPFIKGEVTSIVEFDRMFFLELEETFLIRPDCAAENIPTKNMKSYLAGQILSDFTQEEVILTWGFPIEKIVHPNGVEEWNFPDKKKILIYAKKVYNSTIGIR